METNNVIVPAVVVQQAESDLLEKGYFTIPCPPAAKTLIKIIEETWQRFCEQPLHHKRKIIFGNDVGYENKDRKINENEIDHKENFHIKLGYTFPAGFVPTEVDKKLVGLAKLFLKEMVIQTKKVADIFTQMTGEDFVYCTNDSSGLTLRLLHYYSQMQTVLAHFHPDKGGHTIPISETDPGLEAFWNGEWKIITAQPDELPVFPGLLGQHVSKGQLKALCHRVNSTKISEVNGRYSLVLFCDYPDYEFKYNKDIYKSTQKALGPGENYNMKFVEFNKLFAPRESVIAQ